MPINFKSVMMASPAGATVVVPGGAAPGPDKSFQHTLKGIIAGTVQYIA